MLVRHDGKWIRQCIRLGSSSPHRANKTFGHITYFCSAKRPCWLVSMSTDKAHFHIELREFWLAILTPIFVAEALGELEVAVSYARDHEKLFRLLGR